METYIAALDQGTTSSRAILFNRAGEIVSRAQHPFRQIYPQPGWVEHDPLEIWATEKRALAEVVGAAHIDPKRIAALGITNQRETTILWDRSTGQPVCNAIVWQCRRTAPLCDTLKADGLGPLVAERPADRRLLLRHQDPVAAGPRPRRPGTGGAGGAVRRHGGQLAHLEPHRRGSPRDRLLQCLPDHAL